MKCISDLKTKNLLFSGRHYLSTTMTSSLRIFCFCCCFCCHVHHLISSLFSLILTFFFSFVLLKPIVEYCRVFSNIFFSGCVNSILVDSARLINKSWVRDHALLSFSLLFDPLLLFIYLSLLDFEWINMFIFIFQEK